MEYLIYMQSGKKILIHLLIIIKVDLDVVLKLELMTALGEHYVLQQEQDIRSADGIQRQMEQVQKLLQQQLLLEI
jgi:hypothetical protein